MLLEELAEGGLVCKVQFVGYLLYGEVRGPQQNLCLGGYLFGYPIVGCMSGSLLKHYRQVLCAYAQFV